MSRRGKSVETESRSVCQVVEGGVSFQADESVQELDSGEDCITSCIY